MEEFYKKHRPKLLKQVIGQPDAVNMLNKFVKSGKVPHALLFTGASGCGKTTLARIITDKIKCGQHDITELNCADFRGVDMVREIRNNMGRAPISGECRVYIIDECHQLTKDAQNALLKMLEDTPRHVYFMLCTTDAGKLLDTIKTRCTEIKAKALSPKDIKHVVLSIAANEAVKLSEEVVDRIVEVSGGSARKALVVLNQIAQLDNEEDQLNAIVNSDSKQQAIEIARALMRPKIKWVEMAKVLSEVDDDAEGIRHLVMAYTTNVMLKNLKLAARCYLILAAFKDHFYDSKRAGLVAACYEVVGDIK